MPGRTGARDPLVHRARRWLAVRPAVATLVGAVVLAVWFAWPLLQHLRSVAPADRDSPLFVWSLAHTPHRLAQLHNPFTSSAIFATSGGANLAYNAVAPGLGLLMTPVTLALGPVAALNLLTMVTPVLNALAAHRLLRVVSGRSGWRVTIGALVIGFSPLVLMHDGARFQIAFQAVALLLLAELRLAWADRRDGTLGWLRGVRIGVLVGAQLWIGTELLAITALVAVVAVVALVVCSGVARRLVSRWPVRAEWVALAALVGAAIVVGSPFLIAYLFGPEKYTASYHVAARSLFGLRLANVVTPTPVTAWHAHVPLAVGRGHLGVFPDEDTGYLGVAGVALVVLCVAMWRRLRVTERVALVTLAASVLLALGPSMRWTSGGGSLWGPWHIVGAIPLLKEAVANRVVFGAFIGLGVVVATTPPDVSRLRFAITLLTPVLLLPAQFGSTRVAPQSADDALRSSCAGGLAITMPQDQEQEGMGWQGRAGFSFDLIRGFAFRHSSLPKGDLIGLDAIATGDADVPSGPTAIAELRSRGITCVLVPTVLQATVDRLTPVLGTPTVASDVTIYRVTSPPG